MCLAKVSQGRLPSDNHELHFRCVLVDAAPDVHGEDGRRGVEDGGQRRHQRRHHHCQHQTAEAVRHQLQHQGRVGDVGAPRSTPADAFADVGISTGDLV